MWPRSSEKRHALDLAVIGQLGQHDHLSLRGVEAPALAKQPVALHRPVGKVQPGLRDRLNALLVLAGLEIDHQTLENAGIAAHHGQGLEVQPVPVREKASAVRGPQQPLGVRGFPGTPGDDA